MNEKWLKVPDWHHYSVSNHGRVRSEDRHVHLPQTGWRIYHGRVLAQKTDRYGYKVVHLREKGRSKYIPVHQMVCLAFHGSAPGPPGRLRTQYQVNHIDGDKTNNASSNLEWVLGADNHRHAERTGLLASGERNGFAKLTADQVDEIRRLYDGKEHTTISLGRRYGVSKTQIRNIIRGHQWRSREIISRCVEALAA